MSERVTIDVDLEAVAVLRNLVSADPKVLDNYHGYAREVLADLTASIIAALPKPEPAVGSLVRLPSGALYARVDGIPLPTSWRLINRKQCECDSAWREAWKDLVDLGGTVVFDGATLADG